MLQPGQPGFPTVGTTITMVGYGVEGTGSLSRRCLGSIKARKPSPGGAARGRRPAESGDELARALWRATGLRSEPSCSFFRSFVTADPLRDPMIHNFFGLPPTSRSYEGGIGPGDSGGPLFAMINGQLVQIGVVRGGGGEDIPYCVKPGRRRRPRLYAPTRPIRLRRVS